MSVLEYETDGQLLEQLRADIAREEQGLSIADDARELKGSLAKFIRAAWPIIQADRFVPNWHLDVVADHLEAVSAGDIRRLQIWVPPGTMKSLSCSVFWPSWEWASKPELRLLTGSYDIDLSTRFAVRSRDLMQSRWYTDRWGSRFQFKKDENAKRSYANTRGGERFATSPTAGATGRHAHRILIDDPINAQDADAAERTKLDAVNEWYDSTLSTRSADAKTHAEVIIMQRLAKGDLCDHVRQFEDWTVVCLPERYEAAHPFVMPEHVTLKSGKVVRGDQRKTEGELLNPERRGELESQLLAAKLGSHRAAGQLQQRPASREGGILKRALWDYYDKTFLDDVEGPDGRPTLPLLPAFPMIISSWDTTFKDKVSSDFVAGGIWGVLPGRRYLLRTIVAQMSLSTTKTSMKELRQWGLDRFPHASHRVLVENTANGPEIIAQLKREIPGVIPTKPSVRADEPSTKKLVRAEACEPDFESGSVLVPGARNSTLDGPSGDTPAWAQQVIEQAADFPNGEHDDIVDMVTQLLNWAREHEHKPARGDGGYRNNRAVRVGGLV